jgi:hypothetical protein
MAIWAVCNRLPYLLTGSKGGKNTDCNPNAGTKTGITLL